MQHVIRCAVLGPLQASLDDSAVPAALLWRKHIALLIYLARSPQRRRARDHLVGVFWAEKPESAARHSLTEALRVMRRALGHDAIDTTGGEIRLAGAAVDLDVDRFMQLCAAERWNAAAELVRGEFLTGFAVPGEWAFEEWLAAERAEWRSRGADALVRAAELRLGEGDVAAAVELADRALPLEPVSEPAWRVGMLARAVGGDRSGALALWESCVHTLDERFGIEPGAETTDLAEQIRRERHWRHVAEHAHAGSTGRRAPLVGRDRALGEATSAWRRCNAGEGAALVLVTGEPGAGRSRFVEEIAARARLAGARAVIVRAVEGDAAHDGSTLDALIAALRTAPAAVRAATPALPENAAAARAGDVLAAVLRDECRQQPVLLTIDDAHLADRASLLELERCVRTIARDRLLVLLTRSTFPHRPELDAVAARLGRDVAGTSITLEPLSGKPLCALIRWAMPAYGEDAVDRLARRLLAETAGLPLLVIELLHAIALGLELGDDVEPWPNPLRTMEHTLPADAPESITAAIRVGFRRLSPAAQRGLAALSLLGERVAADALAAATELDDASLAIALDELEWQRWIVADPRGFGFTARIARTIVARDLITGGERLRILSRATVA